MNRNALAAALVAGLVLLAGCSSGLTGSQGESATEESALDGQTTAETIEGETGTVNMYISDEENAISDFEHLNVTITKVGVKPAGEETGDEDADDGDDTETGGDDTETEEDDTEADDAENGTETADETNVTDSTATETQTPDDDEADEETESDEDDAADEATEDEAESDDDDADESDDGWVEYEVDNRTVDLTELKGANATKLSSLEVPNGSYDKVFVHVSEVDGTLKDGTDQRVKLPSGKLQLNSGFTVGDGEEVDFVFDITAVKAGNSGKYILKPVISESGTDVEIDDVDDEEERGDDEREDDRANALNASFDGEVVAGENATLSVTSDGEPVEGATVFVDGERAGTTDADGTYVIRVPDDAEELEVEITYEGAETELDGELDSESDGGGTDDGSSTTTEES